MSVRVYEVGGYVRDSFLTPPLVSNDLDYVVECDGGWAEMLAFAHDHLDTIYQVKAEFFTIRGNKDGEGIDLVMARKDGEYLDGRRPESVESGSIYDDLTRRDFTMNAIARRPSTGQVFDPHGGLTDIESKVIRCVGSNDRLGEDHLRALRAIRFSVTLGFAIDPRIETALAHPSIIAGVSRLPRERVQVELDKMFKHDTIKSLEALARLSTPMQEAIFSGALHLAPTMRRK